MRRWNRVEMADEGMEWTALYRSEKVFTLVISRTKYSTTRDTFVSSDGICATNTTQGFLRWPVRPAEGKKGGPHLFGCSHRVSTPFQSRPCPSDGGFLPPDR